MAKCEVCSVTIPEGQEAILRGKDKKAPLIALCPECVGSAERALQAETQNPSLGGAVILGLGAAAAACAAWYAAVVITKYQLGIVALLVGWLVAVAVVRGAGNKRGPAVQVTSAVITALAMAASEYFVVRHLVVLELAKEGVVGVRLFVPPALTLAVIAEGIKSDPLTLLFWAIAIYEAARIPARRRLPRLTAREVGVGGVTSLS